MSSMLANRAPTLPGPQRAIPTEPNRPGPQTLPGPQLPGPQRGMNRALMYSDEHAKDKCTSCAGEAKSPMYSDEHAKQAAYDQGRQHGVASTQAQPVYKKSDSPATRSQVLKDWQGGHGIKDATPMAEANRSMEATPYTYKPEFAARTGQEPGEKNVGPMAQRMAADPVAATAVERDPQTGMLTLDRDKLAKVTSGGVADLQQQMDQLREHIKNPPRSIMAQRFGAMRKR